MPTAVLSVYDKSGLIDFARSLNALGWKLLASGGTARALRDNDLPVTDVAEYTGSPEILGGRVKTLHPAIHGGLLARDTDADRKQLTDLGWDTIDLVAVNLYPFEMTVAKPGVTFEEAIENIDIGGVTLIRAAAKNHERVTLVCDPADYAAILSELNSGGVTAETRRRLAARAFALTTQYDAHIADYLAEDKPLRITGYPVQSLRYGENPHQSAALYSLEPGAGPLGGTLLQGKELSYNNLLDLDSAWTIAQSFEKTTIAIVKHLSPCGVASDPTLSVAFTEALACDPVSAFGGVIGSNRPFDGETARALGDLFVECIAAPGFTEEARQILSQRKNCRLLEIKGQAAPSGDSFELRTISGGGLLRQSVDAGDPPDTEMKVVSQRQPTEEEWASLRFAWKVCQHVKSNSIVFTRGEATVGVGGGQPNRVDSVRIAANRAGDKSRGAAMASDAFFPFPDSVEAAAAAGVTAIIHPGGSIRDDEAIAAADAANIAMVTTGVRHFRH